MNPEGTYPDPYWEGVMKKWTEVQQGCIPGLDTLIDLADEPGIGVCMRCGAPLTADEFGVCGGCTPKGEEPGASNPF